MEDPKEIKIAWVIWSLISHLNDRLWDRYEEEFLKIISERKILDDYDRTILNLTKLDLP